jgi:hypothetical protein
MKRNNSYRRSLSEQRADNHKHYDMCFNDAVKGKSKVNPIFTRKPYSMGKEDKIASIQST